MSSGLYSEELGEAVYERLHELKRAFTRKSSLHPETVILNHDIYNNVIEYVKNLIPHQPNELTIHGMDVKPVKWYPPNSVLMHDDRVGIQFNLESGDVEWKWDGGYYETELSFKQ